MLNISQLAGVVLPGMCFSLVAWLFNQGQIHTAQLPWFFGGMFLLQLLMPALGPNGLGGTRAAVVAVSSLIVSVFAYQLGATDAFMVGLPVVLFVAVRRLQQVTDPSRGEPQSA